MLKNKTKAGRIRISTLTITALIPTVWNEPKNRHIGQWEQKRELRNKPTHLRIINIRQKREEHAMGKGLFNKLLGKLNHFLIPYTKINSKLIKA